MTAEEMIDKLKAMYAEVSTLVDKEEREHGSRTKLYAFLTAQMMLLEDICYQFDIDFDDGLDDYE